MNRTKRIKQILQKHFQDFKFKIIDNSLAHKGHNSFEGEPETHLLLELTNVSSLKVNRLEIHRKINSLLNKEFQEGLHSLQIKII